MRRMKLRWTILVLFLITVFIGSSFPRVFSQNPGDEAVKAIGRADDAVSSAFAVVLDAEKTGANVSRLRGNLNEAVNLLSQAKILLADGDPLTAVQVANLSAETAQSVGSQASSLEASTLAAHEVALRITLAGSSIGIVVFLSSMFLLWRWFRRRYVLEIQDLRPEATADA